MSRKGIETMSSTFSRTVLSGLAVFTIGLSTMPASLSAQATFTACRIPDVGAIYMIGLAGLPTECLDPSHVEFSWTEGGSVADGGITTPKLADGAVTTTKLADAVVTASKLAAGVVDSLTIANGSILGEDLKSGTIGSAQITNGSISGDDVEDASLTAADLADGAAGAIIQADLGDSGSLTTTAVDLGNVSYIAPAEGVALVLVTGTVRVGGENTRVRIGIGTSSGSFDSNETWAGYQTGAGTADLDIPFSTMGAVQIGVGGISRYYVSAQLEVNDQADTAELVGVRAMLIYVPTRF